MSVRFLRLSSNFKAYLPILYAERLGLTEQLYAEQLTAHLYNAFECSDIYSVHPAGSQYRQRVEELAPIITEYLRSRHEARWHNV
ncbi:MAG TPA: hypothetical protein VMT24_04265 [Aggregatilineaceae bacterium]|jgi:hypothetical protein|nr:hypothetical protein [Aggregatilineaceae bacterium]